MPMQDRLEKTNKLHKSARRDDSSKGLKMKKLSTGQNGSYSGESACASIVLSWHAGVNASVGS